MNIRKNQNDPVNSTALLCIDALSDRQPDAVGTEVPGCGDTYAEIGD